VSITPQTKSWLRQSAALDGAVVSQTLLNLLERVEALEASRPHDILLPAPPAAPAGRLVERVAEKMGPQSQAAMDAGELPYGAARAAIREVAAWMRENEVGYNAARWLEQEADCA
jgi:hypothetical protein